MTDMDYVEIWNTPVAEFILADFEEFLSKDEMRTLAEDENSRHKLRDRFLDACVWNTAAEIAVEVWREHYSETA